MEKENGLDKISIQMAQEESNEDTYDSMQMKTDDQTLSQEMMDFLTQLNGGKMPLTTKEKQLLANTGTMESPMSRQEQGNYTDSRSMAERRRSMTQRQGGKRVCIPTDIGPLWMTEEAALKYWALHPEQE